VRSMGEACKMDHGGDALLARAMRYQQLAEQEQHLASLATDPEEAAQHQLIANLYRGWADEDRRLTRDFRAQLSSTIK
jgi:hypothetical protein